MVFVFQATGWSKALGMDTTIEIRPNLSDEDTFSDEDLNRELAYRIAKSDAETYLDKTKGAISVEFVRIER